MANQAPQTTADEPEDARPRLGEAVRSLPRYAALWPLVLGLAFSRSGLIVATYGSYASTDQGVFTDGAMLATLVVLAALFLALLLSKRTIGKRAVNLAARTCVALQAVCLIGLALAGATKQSVEIQFALSSLHTLASSGAIFYWLRRARGTSTTAAVVFVFSALIVSEVEIYLCLLLPPVAADLTALALVCVQYPCMLWARERVQPYKLASPTLAHDYFSFAKTAMQSKQFLMATAIGIGCLSVVIGLLRGYPSGEAIAFAPGTRAAYGALNHRFVRHDHRARAHAQAARHDRGDVCRHGASGLPGPCDLRGVSDMLDIGAVFTTTLNALMVAFTWYIIIAFMSYGWRDPYYYAIAGWLVWLGCRAVSRVAIMELYPASGNDMLMNAVMGGFLVLSTQVVFVQFLAIALDGANEQKRRSERRQGVVSALMALDQNESMSELRQASMQHNAEEMGRQFLLSEREVEVLALYALGHTQKRVPRSCSSRRAPRTRTSSASTRRRGCTPARRSSTTSSSTRRDLAGAVPLGKKTDEQRPCYPR